MSEFGFPVFAQNRKPWHSAGVKNVSLILIEKLSVCQGVLSSPCYPYGFHGEITPSRTGKVSEDCRRKSKSNRVFSQFLNYYTSKHP